MQFYIVDVFAEQKYAGNQLAVFRGEPSPEMMQTLALEMNFSETTFITSDQSRDGGYDVRIFTPGAELPFAGHPTLGTAYIIQREIIGQPVEKVVLNLKVGQIPVTFHDDGVLWMRQNAPEFGRIYDAADVANMLGLSLDDMDTRFPIQEASTGVGSVIAPLKTIDAVKRAKMNLDVFMRMIEDGENRLGVDSILFFAPETYYAENDLNVRVFADPVGVPEDPATGSANGSMAGYLVKHRYFGADNFKKRVEQGYEIDRPSLLLLDASDRGNYIEVNVGGRVQMVARGELAE